MGIRTFRVINGNRHIEQTAKKFGLLNGHLATPSFRIHGRINDKKRVISLAMIFLLGALDLFFCCIHPFDIPHPSHINLFKDNLTRYEGRSNKTVWSDLRIMVPVIGCSRSLI